MSAQAGAEALADSPPPSTIEAHGGSGTAAVKAPTVAPGFHAAGAHTGISSAVGTRRRPRPHDPGRGPRLAGPGNPELRGTTGSRS